MRMFRLFILIVPMALILAKGMKEQCSLNTGQSKVMNYMTLFTQM